MFTSAYNRKEFVEEPELIDPCNLRGGRECATTDS
ncbi:Protein of unknown function [Pyronema omphalodes CBS 100304]|uniref:Uncharacterized protein n=1 Tax=Pyronema omphalodes (strain CBS 100304) TaxID=1076935 RepID=U4KYS3_PYROM|nr:Protein of unknown function [Pyronema omphalodes CBS 100304]